MHARVCGLYIQARKSAEAELERLRLQAEKGTVTARELEQKQAAIHVKLKAAVEEFTAMKTDADRRMAAAGEREEALIAQAAAEKEARQALVVHLRQIEKEAAEGKLSQQQMSQQTVEAEQKLKDALCQAAAANADAETRIAAAISDKEKLEADMKVQTKATAAEKAVRLVFAD